MRKHSFDPSGGKSGAEEGPHIFPSLSLHREEAVLEKGLGVGNFPVVVEMVEILEKHGNVMS